MVTERDPLSFADLAQANLGRCETSYHPLDDWSPCDWMTAVTGEVGELASLLKNRRRGDNVLDSDLAFELADVVIYVDLLAQRLGIDLGRAVRVKFNVVSERVKSPIMLESVQSQAAGT